MIDGDIFAASLMAASETAISAMATMPRHQRVCSPFILDYSLPRFRARLRFKLQPARPPSTPLLYCSQPRQSSPGRNPSPSPSSPWPRPARPGRRTRPGRPSGGWRRRQSAPRPSGLHRGGWTVNSSAGRYWSNTGQTLVNYWSNTGQTLVKYGRTVNSSAGSLQSVAAAPRAVTR
jgi:hypothetical protein